MAKIVLNGSPGEVFVNSGSTVLYQFVCSFSNSCGLCISFAMAVGPSWPIPMHRGCNCRQVAIWPGQSAEPFVDFREEIRNLSPSQQSAVMGKSNLRLVESGAVSYEDVVTKTRVRDLREVVARAQLSIREMVNAGVTRARAEQAYRSVHTPAHEIANAVRRQLIADLIGKSIADAAISDAVSRRIAERVGLVDVPAASADATDEEVEPE